MNTKGVNFQPSERGQFSTAVDSGVPGDFVTASGHGFYSSHLMPSSAGSVELTELLIRPYP